jgi:hydroxymethylpyrimidine pyrophosphatase-like HAD family hydrolase
LLVGLRTSGSYFAPLLRAFLVTKGYSNVAFATMQPDKGPGRREHQDLRRRARMGYIAVILDDPPHSGGAVLRALEIVRKTGFAPTHTVALVPIHPARRNTFGSLARPLVIALPPEQWHKNRLLVPDTVQARLAEYFQHNNHGSVQVLQSPRTMDFEDRLQALSFDGRGGRLKRIYEVRLQAQGAEETRFVLAKSVGWGWLGYHAFLAGHRLSGRVPEILGLRDGILYMEWYPQDKSCFPDRATLLDGSADYIAARACRLRMHDGHTAASHPVRHQNAVTLLAKSLSKAHGPVVTGHLLRPRIEQRLVALPCPYPTLIDGKMETEEWIDGPNGPLKTDFEHHGMGKGELNTADTAFDLAQTMLGMEADEAEEATLIQRYIAASGDVNVEQRLFLNKLLAGIWTMDKVRNQLFDKAQDSTKQQRLHHRYMTAWNFLTIQAARACGALCVPSAAPAWRAPLLALDIDGVIDNRIFGFPCTTAAGIQALSLLRAHGFTAILNTARSAAEVKAYCRAYSLAGGVAEYGSCLWDAVSGQEHTLISAEAIAQLQKLRRRLRQIPGVFLDERHRHSIRAFTYQERPRGLLASVRSTGSATAPMPTLLMTDLITEPGLDLLSFQHTTIDTTVIAQGVDKGIGLIALRDWVLGADAEMIAVGDSEPDLPMFQAATQAYAPAHIGCARQARLLGCQIVDAPHQRGLLKIARALVHPDRQYCPRCTGAEITDATRQTLWFHLLQAADGPAASNFLRALQGQGSIKALLR